MFQGLGVSSGVGFGSVLDRRRVLQMGLTGFLAASLPLFLSDDAVAADSRGNWRVSLYNVHTGDSFDGIYRVGDKYLPDSFSEINYVLRDFRTREMFPMDPRVIDIASMIQGRMKLKKPLEVLSGYRSPKTNAMLRRVSTGVAKNSFHMYGQAIDLRVAGKTRQLRDTARSLRGGGVGYYPESGFVHVDTGKVRSW